MHTASEPIIIFTSLAQHAMEAFAKTLGQMLKPEDIVCLRGQVGAGKTTFAQALIYAIAAGTPEVTSPTFNLMQSYNVNCKNSQTGLLWHLDLYRVETERELEALGLDELWAHVVLIEWPEIAIKYIPQDRLDIVFDFDITSPELRTLTLYGNEAWRKRLATVV